eukprot:m.318714 g.318714  ORF g.318714 m.318714 type:complete len:207 (+) comp23086_c2_seq31:805-1425(+)
MALFTRRRQPWLARTWTTCAACVVRRALKTRRRRSAVCAGHSCRRCRCFSRTMLQSSPLKPAARFCYACENKVPAKFWERLHGQNRTAAPHNHHHHGDTLRTAQPQEQPDSFHLSHPLSHNGHHGQHTLSHTASLQASLSRDAHLAGMNPIHSRETNMTQKLSPKTCIKCGCENSPVLTHCSRCEAVLPVLQGSVHLHQPQCARTA